MTLYLSLNNTTDVLKTPSINFDEVIMDFIPNQVNGNYYFDARSGIANAYFLRNTSGTDTSSASSPFANGIYLNGTKISYTSSGVIPSNQRMTLRFVLSVAGTDDVNLFSQSSNANRMSALVYDIQFLKAGTLVAHYDMSTGTVQDVSGNGNHATLTGGTWVDDGAGGGTPTTLTVSLSDSVTLSELLTKSPSKRLSDALTISEILSKQGNLLKSDSITLSDTLSKSLTVTVVDTVSMGDTSTASQGGKSASLSDTVIVTDAIVKKVISTYKNDAVNLSDVDNHIATKQLLDSIASSDSITVSNGKSIILSDSITVTDAIFKAVSVIKSDSITLADSTSKMAKIGVYDVMITADDLSILNPQAPEIIGTIHLKGSATLNVYLVGSQTLNVNLKGGI